MSIKLENNVDRYSYALAMNIFGYVNQLPVTLNKEVIKTAFADLFKNLPPALTQEQYVAAMQDFQKQVDEFKETKKAKDSEIGKENIENEKKFLAENAKKEGIVTTESGLQYQVITEGTGGSPAPANVVKVHYEGKLLDGKIFDSSMKRGVPAEFPVNQVIPGWTEALQLMKVGGKNRLFIPAALAYGAHGAGDAIAPHSTLIFDVELIDIVK